MNHDVLLLDRYHPTKNPDGAWPRVDKADSGNNVNTLSDFWLRDASYLRVSNLNINWDMPAITEPEDRRRKTLDIRECSESLHLH